MLTKLGGFAGLLVVLVSYILQLEPEPPLQLEDLDAELQAWYKKGSMVEVLGHNMFTVSEVLLVKWVMKSIHL